MSGFKDIYIERYKKLLGDEWDIFREAIVKPFPSSFRINTIKAKQEEVAKELKEKGWKIQIQTCPVVWP